MDVDPFWYLCRRRVSQNAVAGDKRESGSAVFEVGLGWSEGKIKMQGEKTTKTRPIVIQLPSTFETIRDEILSHHNSGTLSKEQKNAHFILLSGTGAPLDEGFIPYLNSGEKVILFERKKEGNSSSRDRSNSSYDSLLGKQKKRSRAVSVHLQTVHKLFQTKVITEDEKYLVRRIYTSLHISVC